MTSDIEIRSVELPASVSEFTNWMTDHGSDMLRKKITTWVFSYNQWTHTWTIGDLVVSAKKSDLLLVTFWYQPPSGASEDIPPEYDNIVAETIDDAVEYFSSTYTDKDILLHDLVGFKDAEKIAIIIKSMSGPKKEDFLPASEVAREINKAVKGDYNRKYVDKFRSRRGWIEDNLPD